MGNYPQEEVDLRRRVGLAVQEIKLLDDALGG
jgi:hypothetical protein